MIFMGGRFKFCGFWLNLYNRYVLPFYEKGDFIHSSKFGWIYRKKK